MKKNSQKIKQVEQLLQEALNGIKQYLSHWSVAPQNFTTEKELQLFATKFQEMQDSFSKDKAIPILGVWRILETWPYKNELRKKMIEAEYEYERLGKVKEEHKNGFKF